MTSAYVNHPVAVVRVTSRKYEMYFSPATFNDFAAWMHWGEHGAGNCNPVVVLDGDASLDNVLVSAAPGTSVALDASATRLVTNDSRARARLTGLCLRQIPFAVQLCVTAAA